MLSALDIKQIAALAIFAGATAVPAARVVTQHYAPGAEESPLHAQARPPGSAGEVADNKAPQPDLDGSAPSPAPPQPPDQEENENQDQEFEIDEDDAESDAPSPVADDSELAAIQARMVELIQDESPMPKAMRSKELIALGERAEQAGYPGLEATASLYLCSWGMQRQC